MALSAVTNVTNSAVVGGRDTAKYSYCSTGSRGQGRARNPSFEKNSSLDPITVISLLLAAMMWIPSGGIRVCSLDISRVFVTPALALRMRLLPPLTVMLTGTTVSVWLVVIYRESEPGRSIIGGGFSMKPMKNSLASFVYVVGRGGGPVDQTGKKMMTLTVAILHENQSLN